MASAGKPKRVLIVVENLPAPFDRRVWQEACALRAGGYEVSIICPVGRGSEKRHEVIDDIHIYRHPLPIEANGAVGYVLEYANALFWEFLLAFRVYFSRGFDVIQGCNPPDTVFLVALFFKLLGKKYVFDHHDICPELYEAKFNRRDAFYRLLVLLERWTFRAANVSMATNESYRRIAIERGRMEPGRVFVVRNGPDFRRVRAVPPVPALKNGRRFLVGYVGVIERQEGIDSLLRMVRLIVRERQRNDVQFCLVGGGTELEDLKKYAAELGVADYVTFTGRASDDMLMQVLNTAEVCVNPDIANTMNDMSTMTKIMEYMALGKPIVQYDLTEGRYSAQDASLYAKQNDEADFAGKILELLDDPAQRRKMGEAGKRRVESELAWEFQVPKLLATYDALWAAS